MPKLNCILLLTFVQKILKTFLIEVFEIFFTAKLLEPKQNFKDFLQKAAHFYK